MDLLYNIDNGQIHTDQFEKKLNLYLYILPASVHPPGVLTGLVSEQFYMISTLVSRPENRKRHYKNLYHPLIMCNYKTVKIIPLMQRPIR